MMVKLKEQYPERNKELLEVLGINPTWRLNSVSEGQRKRVQLYLNLIQPFKVCLLDEITVNLDLLVKDRFMRYLKKETEQRDCCILYVTHIFDGIDDRATDLIYMKKDQQIETVAASSIPNIYRFLLERFSDEHDSTVTEQEEQQATEGRKNAGGYSHGVLGDHMTLTSTV
jgi:CCR4-NOT complex subunit CAF16